MTDKPVEQHPPGHSASFIKDIESVEISGGLHQTLHNGQHHQNSRIYRQKQTAPHGNIYNIYPSPPEPAAPNYAGDNCGLPSRPNDHNQRRGGGEPILARETQQSFQGSPRTPGPFPNNGRRPRHEADRAEAADNRFNARTQQPFLPNNQHPQSIDPMFMRNAQQYQNNFNWPHYLFLCAFSPLAYVVNPVYVPWMPSPPFIPVLAVPDVEPDVQVTSQGDKRKRRRKRKKKQEPLRTKPL